MDWTVLAASGAHEMSVLEILAEIVMFFFIIRTLLAIRQFERYCECTYPDLVKEYKKLPRWRLLIKGLPLWYMSPYEEGYPDDSELRRLRTKAYISGACAIVSLWVGILARWGPEAFR